MSLPQNKRFAARRLLCLLLALAFGLALYKTIDNKRRGKSCGGNCSACGAACSRRK